MNILSINFNHDGAGVILRDGKMAAYVNTERYSRLKKHPGIREQDLDELLHQANLTLSELNCVVLCNVFWQQSPDIINRHGSDLEDTLFECQIDVSASTISIRGVLLPAIVNPNHYLLHNAMVYYSSPFDAAMCFSWDPSNTGAGAAIGSSNALNELAYEAPWHSSYIYCDASGRVFDSGLFGAGKLMGLAPYGAKSTKPESYQNIANMSHLLALSVLDPVQVSFSDKTYDASLAFHAQNMLNEHLETILDDLYEIGMKKGMPPLLCLSGGTALNSVSNELAFKASKFEDVYIAPACGDDGTAIGGALYAYHHLMKFPKLNLKHSDVAYSVKKYDDDIDSAIANHPMSSSLNRIESSDYMKTTAELLSKGKIIAWFNEGSEIGPRSLGNRSILADPRDPKMKDKLNGNVKFRESFRPFAPSVMNEHALDYFSIKDSPFMLRVCDVITDDLPAITHVDGTARIQTVTKEINANFYELLSKFNELTGCPVLVNTSFNIKGEPIVETPEHAINCFLGSGIDALVFKNTILVKHPDFNQQEYIDNRRLETKAPQQPFSMRCRKLVRVILRNIRRLVRL